MVSIIIPTYNNPRNLVRTLKNIEQQTHKDFEVIVVDDGSEGDIKQVVYDTFRTNGIMGNKFKFYRIEHGGANKARNYGFSQSKGEHVIFWDDDILAEPEMLATMLEALERHSEAAYAYCSFRYGWKAFKLWPYDPKRLRQMPYIHTTSLIRREHFPGFDENVKRLQDWDLWLTMLEQNHRGVYIPKFLFKTTGGRTMSAWLPNDAFKAPWKWFLLPSWKLKAKGYEEAVALIKSKHNL